VELSGGAEGADVSITVYTVILDGYDNLRQPAVVEPGVRYVCFADEPIHCPPWEIQPAWRRYPQHRKNARIPKILAHLHVDTEYSIYHDGCLQMTAKPSELIEQYLKDADLAMYRHPCRRSIYEEAAACERLEIGYGQEMQQQVERYRSHGLGDELWAGGVICRRHTDIVAMFNEIWWSEYIDGCSRDQFALAFARYSVGLKANTIPGDILQDAERFQFCFHAAFVDLGGNARFTDERARRAERGQRLSQLCR
jgi:hypothetical protein